MGNSKSEVELTHIIALKDNRIFDLQKENKWLKEEIERMKEEKHYDDLQAKADGAHEDWLDSKEERDY